VTDLLARNMMAKSYVGAFAERGSRSYICNLETHVSELRWGKHVVPITVNNGEKIGTFVCSPTVGYVDYVKEELPRFPHRPLIPALKVIVDCVGAALSVADMNRIVHINNWMMSTNLPINLDPDLASSQTQSLVSSFPRHFLAMRSLNWRHTATVMRALVDAGWFLLPSRQVYLVNDVAKESLVRRDSKNDQRVWQASHFDYQELTEMSHAEAERIAQLYKMLYLEKYSCLNPAFTPEFVRLTHSIGMVKYLIFRDSAGKIQSFGGLHRLGSHATMPLMGYDTSAAQELGLYRLACHAGSLYAAKHELQLNMSSGAAKYKRTRGATPEMEFTAYYLRHLPTFRRLPVQALRLVANRIGIPILRRYEL
jgi:hypothetical protein